MARRLLLFCDLGHEFVWHSKRAEVVKAVCPLRCSFFTLKSTSRLAVCCQMIVGSRSIQNPCAGAVVVVFVRYHALDRQLFSDVAQHKLAVEKFALQTSVLQPRLPPEDKMLVDFLSSRLRVGEVWSLPKDLLRADARPNREVKVSLGEQSVLHETLDVASALVGAEQKMGAHFSGHRFFVVVAAEYSRRHDVAQRVADRLDHRTSIAVQPLAICAKAGAAGVFRADARFTFQRLDLLELLSANGVRHILSNLVLWSTKPTSVLELVMTGLGEVGQTLLNYAQAQEPAGQLQLATIAPNCSASWQSATAVLLSVGDPTSAVARYDRTSGVLAISDDPSADDTGAPSVSIPGPEIDDMIRSGILLKRGQTLGDDRETYCLNPMAIRWRASYDMAFGSLDPASHLFEGDLGSFHKKGKLDFILMLSRAGWQQADLKKGSFHLHGAIGEFVLDASRPRQYYEALVRSEEILLRLPVPEGECAVIYHGAL